MEYSKSGMLIQELVPLLSQTPSHTLAFRLPNGREIPAAVHITEVAVVTKEHIDCGGDHHRSETCVLQTWLAGNDPDHRVDGAKLLKILGLAAPIIRERALPVEVEHEDGLVSQYPITGYRVETSRILFELGLKHTDCAAKDRCGLTPVTIKGPVDSACRPGLGNTGCC